jgi:cobalt-zinc-cadmium efflux system outer membrane protein
MARQAGLWPNPSAGYDADEIRGGSFSGGEQGAFVQQDIVLGGKLRMRRNVFEQQQRANVIAVEEQKLSVRGAVQTRFYTALAQLRVVDVERDLMGIAMDAAATAHQLANVGQADAPDVLQAEVEAEQVKLAFVRAQRAYIVAFQRLALVAGDTRMPLSLLEGDLGETPEIDPDKYLEDLMAHSPTLKRAQQQVTRAEAELAESRRDVIPDLTLKAGIHQNREINDLSLRRVGVEGFAGVGIQLPIFNRNQGNIEASRASVERSREEVQRIKLELSETAQALLQRYLSSKEDVERYNTQLIPRARRAYQLYVQKYQNMAAAYPEVIVSQRTLSQLEESYARSLSDLWNAAIQLQNYLLVDGLEPAVEAARGVNTAGTSGSHASATE